MLEVGIVVPSNPSFRVIRESTAMRCRAHAAFVAIFVALASPDEGVYAIIRMAINIVRRLIQIAVLLLVLIHVGGPLFETVDHWDQFSQGQGGDDLVLSVLSLVAGCGLTLLVGYFLRNIVEPSLTRSLLSFIFL